MTMISKYEPFSGKKGFITLPDILYQVIHHMITDYNQSVESDCVAFVKEVKVRK